MEIDKKFIVAGAIFGALGVILGALGAHALKSVLDQNSLDSFNTGVKYQIYHALLLIVLSVISPAITQKTSTGIFYLLCFGIIFFSFSIYMLNLGPKMNLNTKFLGPVTPMGGLLLIAAWLWIAIEFVKTRT